MAAIAEGPPEKWEAELLADFAGAFTEWDAAAAARDREFTEWKAEWDAFWAGMPPAEARAYADVLGIPLKEG